MPLYNRPQPTPQTPRSGDWQPPAGVVSSGTNSPADKVAYFTAVDVNPGFVATALRFNVATAEVGLVGSCFVALYRDDGTLGYPLLAGGPVVSGSVAMAASGNTTGIKVVTLGTPLPMSGRWWTAFLWASTSGTQTTALGCTSITSAVVTPNSNSLSPGTVIRGYTQTATTALPTTAQTLTFNGGNLAPFVEVRAA